MPYDAPGHADALSPELAERWNATIRETFDGLSGLESRFFSIDDGALTDRAEVDAVHWPGIRSSRCRASTRTSCAR